MDVLTLLRKRDEQGLSLLYDSYGQALFGIILSIVRHNETAEEILQETFLKVWNGIESFQEGKGTLFTWMATIARNKSIDKIRLKSYASTEEMSPALSPVIESAPDSHIDASNLLGKLELHQREVLDLVYLQGYTQQQAADALSIPLGTVKTRIRLALQVLRKELK